MLIGSCKDAANPSECIRKCILSGYFPNVAKMQPDGTYRLVKGDIVSPPIAVLILGIICPSQFGDVQSEGKVGYVS
jgi:hypothetical protein